MANCKECVHEKLCVIKAFPDAFENTEWSKKPCDHFKPTADVVPKSEVDRLQAEVKVLTKNSITSKYPCCVSCSKGLILTKSLEEYDKLLADIANEVAREIFEEIEKIIQYSYYADELGEWHDETLLLGGIDELKKKYTEENK